MWAEHDVFGAPLPPCHHLQPQHLPGLLFLAHLLPPRGESIGTARSRLKFCLFLLQHNIRVVLVVWGGE